MRSLTGIRSICLLGLMAVMTFALAGCPDNPYCGDNQCQLSDGENASTCPMDCQPVCGDGACTGNESHASCVRDCPVECGDGSCDGGETFQNCPGDCPPPPVCGDGLCDGAENGTNCPSDCPTNVCTGNFPVDCQDGTGCWTAGTNCSSNVFSCSGPKRCGSTANWAFCCSDLFIQCPGSTPYFCPQDGLCYPSGGVPGYCNPGFCTLVLGDC